jgi:diguanylate cyclase (GGDEF)-like protein/PAS domain S-box-containing protein
LTDAFNEIRDTMSARPMTLSELDCCGLFDASPNPYLVLDRKLNIAGANRAYLAATRRELADIIGRWAWDAFPTDPATLQQSVASFERVIRTGQPDTMAMLRFDIPRPQADGGGFEARYWSIIHTPVLNEAGEVELVLQHPIDVTELQQLRDLSHRPQAPGSLDPGLLNLAAAQSGIVNRAQSVHEANLALKADSDRLRALFQQSPSPVVVLAGKAHVFELVNEAYYQFVGRRDLVGKPFLEALPEVAGQGFDVLLDQVFDSGQPFVGRGMKAALQQADGKLADVYFDLLCQPLFGSDGAVTGIFCQLNDVTEAYRAQAALLESRERLQEGMDAARMMVWDWDIVSGQVTLSENAAAIVGGAWDRPESIFQSIHPDDQQAVRNARLQATPEQPRYRAEFRLNRPDTGNMVWLEIRAQVLFDANREQCHVKGVTLDITERKRTEEQLRAQSEKLQIATEAAELGLFDHNLLTGAISWSDKVYEHFGVPATVTPSRELLFERFHPDDRERMREILENVFTTGSNGSYQAEYRTIGLDGRQRWIAARGRVLYDPLGRPARLVGTSMDISERKRTEKKIQQAAQHDNLTGLPNRSLLAEYCSHILAMSARSGEPGALLFIDLDRFKPINDLYGHDAGDKVLQEVARRLLGCTRKGDIVSRLGGDEFIVVLPRIESPHDPAKVAQHILDAIDQPIAVGAHQLNVSPSIGISQFPQQGTELELLIRCADLAMYSAKKAGRNNFKTYAPGLNEQASDLLRLELQLRDSLESGRFALFYQPIIDIQSKKLVGAEALVRMTADDGSLLGPADFIAVAESVGLINPLGDWVLREACRQHQRWQAGGLPELPIAINVSAVQFRQPAFVAALAHAIAESGMEPSCLQIEITESVVMDNLADTVAKLQQLRSMGIRISLDDFGTGYSSLSYLSSLPLDKLKIDQSFIHELASSQHNRSIAEAIIGLGRTLKLTVVGEGIESEDAMEYLRHVGCEQAQGFFFSAPLPAPQFEAWCRSYH